MSNRRLHFEDLPVAARRAVEKQVGEIRTARTAEGGSGSGIATLLVTEAGTLFVKGLPADDPQGIAQGRELAVGPYLPASSPRLLWYIKVGGWNLVGYEAVDGVHADYRDSGDLVLVLDALSELQQVTVPEEPGALLSAESRWAKYADEGCAPLFAGSTLLHTDPAPSNVLVGERAHFIDWAWPTRGAAFIDPYLLAVWLVGAGHRPGEAVTWVRRLQSWREAPTEALEAFAVAATRMWREVAHDDPQPWKVTMAGGASALRTFLLTTPWARNCG